MIPPPKLQKYIEEGTVQIAPLAYMRGRTLDNAFVILDEAQNTTLPQIKMFLTRMGRNAKFIVTGDVTQIDLPRRSDSGLTRAMEILRGVEGIGIVEFDPAASPTTATTRAASASQVRARPDRRRCGLSTAALPSKGENLGFLKLENEMRSTI